MIADAIATCPCCSSIDSTFKGRLPNVEWFAGVRLHQALDGGGLFECTQCHLLFRFPLQPPETYAKLYNQPSVAIWSGTVRRRDWELIETRLLRNETGARQILDYGCHTGGLLRHLAFIQERYGVEINASAAEFAALNSKAVIFPSLSAIPNDLRFDAITACDVIEHVENPRELVSQLLSLLKPTGSLILTTGDANASLWKKSGANWWYCFYPEHIAFISRDWLNYYEKNGDFIVVECTNFRQGSLSFLRRKWEHLLIHAYRTLPDFLLAAARLARKLRGKGPPASVPGNGATADHLFAVLTRAKGTVPS